MPTFDYHGHRITIDHLYSYARVSSPQQLEANGGEGIGRQIELGEEFGHTYGIPLEPLADLGRSGSKDGRQIALQAFMSLAVGRKLKANPGLAVESFSRLSRLPIDLAMELFLQIIGKGGVTLVTLADRRAYTRASLRANPGEIYMVASMMQAARSTSESIGYYSVKAWRNRRGSASNVRPSWIARNGDQLDLDPEKHAIVVRFCHMALDLGVDQLARTLNSEGVPLISNRKQKRGPGLWDKGGLLKILRSRTLIGQQDVGRYIDGKRHVVPDQFTDAYPPAIDVGLWNRIQSRLDSRTSSQTRTTRSGEVKTTNLFGNLCRCGACDERMRAIRRGGTGQYVYLCCPHRKRTRGAGVELEGCANQGLFRLDRLEKAVLVWIANATLDDTPSVDAATALMAQITKAQIEVAKIQAGYQRAMLRVGALAEVTQAKLEVDFQAKRDHVTRLERELATLRSGTPAKELQGAVKAVWRRALDGDIAARRTVANALPGLVKRVTCGADRTLHVELAGRGHVIDGSWDASQGTRRR